MKILKFLILCLIFSQYSGIKAQSYNISVDTIIGFPSQAYFDSTYQFNVILRNYDSIYFQGDVYIAYRVDTTTGTIGGLNAVNISGDSIVEISITGYSFDSSALKMGGNVVVVWPVNNNGTQPIAVTDTFYTYVEILEYTGISELEKLDANYNVFPVPASDIIFLPQNIAENSIEHIRIIDMLGRQKYFSDKAVTSINTSFLEQGIYFIEIKEKNKTPNVLKFIISR